MTSSDELQASYKYRLIAELGRGGMGEVCLAVAHGAAGWKKLVALKRARPDLSEAPDFLMMFLDEARLAARLNHPNVIQTYEAGQEAERYFIAMEYLDGQPFHRVRSRVGPQYLPLAMQVRILIESLAGLHYAHELEDFDGTPLGVVHRDVTPQNIFVTYDGQIKVVDFGIAKAQSSMLKTRPGMLKGKVTYMAPEQARREPLDRRADIFAVGVMLWEAITGERMWAGVFDSEILRRLSTGKIPSPEGKALKDDPELEKICLRALSPQPAKRYATAEAFQQALERWFERKGEETSTRMVGRFVAEHFEEDRARLKAVLEHELRGYCPGSQLLKVTGADPALLDVESTVIESKAPASASAPTSAPASVSASVSVPVSVSAPVSASGSISISVSVSLTVPATLASAVPVTTRSPSLEPVSTRTRSRGLLSPEPAREEEEEEYEPTLRHSSVSIDTIVDTPLEAASRFPQRRPWLLKAGSAAMIAGVAAFCALKLWGPSAVPAASASTSATEVNLTIRVSPATAQIFLDGAPVSTGSYKGKLLKDDRIHAIRAEAPSFVPMEQAITAGGEVIVSLALEREPAP